MPVSVTLGAVQMDQGTDWIEVDGGEWGPCRIRSRFEKDPNIYMMPISSPNGFQGQSVAFVQVAAPTLLWIVEWAVSRWRNSPTAPNPSVNDSNWVLLNDYWSPDDAKEGQGGDIPFFALRGRFVYGHKNPDPSTWHNVTYPRCPWIEDIFSRAIPDSSLEQGLIDAPVRNISQTGIPQPLRTP